MNKYKQKLPRDDLKKFAKEISKKLVESDYKHNRVGDPTKVNDKIERGVKKFAKEFFDKCVKRHVESERKKAEKKAQGPKTNGETSHTPPGEPEIVKKDEDHDEDIKLEADEEMLGLDDDDEDVTPSDLKRKRESIAMTPSDVIPKDEDSPTSPKKLKSNEAPPPPPPPPPPAPEGMDLDNAEPLEDVTMDQSVVEDSFTQEAMQAVNAAQQDDVNQTASSKFENGDINGQPSPKQLATPSTNGSYPYDASRKLGDIHAENVKQERVTDKR